MTLRQNRLFIKIGTLLLAIFAISFVIQWLVQESEFGAAVSNIVIEYIIPPAVFGSFFCLFFLGLVPKLSTSRYLEGEMGYFPFGKNFLDITAKLPGSQLSSEIDHFLIIQDDPRLLAQRAQFQEMKGGL